MNQKIVTSSKANEKPEKTSSNPKIHVKDIIYSDSDTVTEFSNKEFPNFSREDDVGNLIIVRIFDDNFSDPKIAENLGDELRSLQRNFKVFCAPHQSTLLFANEIDKKRQDRNIPKVTAKFAEPAAKFRFLPQNEIQKMKLAAVFSKTSWSAKNNETSEEISKRIEWTYEQIFAQFSDVVFVCGSNVAEVLVNFAIKNAKIRAPLQQNAKIQIDHYTRKKEEWKRVAKQG
ncbi:unnamed protein product [Caenorhabditis angaria]|uniref:Uncharacterized protein n=1 Tax=Caenorhabditis angaria TaxID=860376 RepID=A0A9P1N5G3_9PELO|nr:unnamed protein product [Caenorhabditis angaria]